MLYHAIPCYTMLVGWFFQYYANMPVIFFGLRGPFSVSIFCIGQRLVIDDPWIPYLRQDMTWEAQCAGAASSLLFVLLNCVGSPVDSAYTLSSSPILPKIGWQKNSLCNGLGSIGWKQYPPWKFNSEFTPENRPGPKRKGSSSNHQTNISPLKINGWKIWKMNFLLGKPIFTGELLVFAATYTSPDGEGAVLSWQIVFFKASTYWIQRIEGAQESFFFFKELKLKASATGHSVVGRKPTGSDLLLRQSADFFKVKLKWTCDGFWTQFFAYNERFAKSWMVESPMEKLHIPIQSKSCVLKVDGR